MQHAGRVFRSEETADCGRDSGLWKRLWTVEETVDCGRDSGLWKRQRTVEETADCGRDSGLWTSAEYASFSVSAESDFYRLSVSGYSGDAGDALAATVHPATRVNGMRFSTPDVDNDNHPTQCLSGVMGWWENVCARSTINFDTKADWNADTSEFVQDVTDARMMVKLD